MFHLKLFLSFALLLLVKPGLSEAQEGDLSGMKEISIAVAPLDQKAMSYGIDEATIENEALVLLRSKLPRLLPNHFAKSAIYVFVNINHAIAGSDIVGHYGTVAVGVKRNVAILETGRITSGYLWFDFALFAGPRSNANENVRWGLNQLLTIFAADWYRNNPSR